MYYGEDVYILSDTSPQEFGDVRIVGVPYEPVEIEEVFSRIQGLRSILKDDKTNILMYHGELLDLFFSREDMGDEGQRRYMIDRSL